MCNLWIHHFLAGLDFSWSSWRDQRVFYDEWHYHEPGQWSFSLSQNESPTCSRNLFGNQIVSYAEFYFKDHTKTCVTVWYYDVGVLTLKPLSEKQQVSHLWQQYSCRWILSQEQWINKLTGGGTRPFICQEAIYWNVTTPCLCFGIQGQVSGISFPWKHDWYWKTRLRIWCRVQWFVLLLCLNCTP